MKDFHPEIVASLGALVIDLYLLQAGCPKMPGCGDPWEITAAAHNLGALEAD